MKKKTKFIQNFATIILAISIPGLLALASFETKRYATLEKEVLDLEKKQYELIENNKKLVSEIGMLSSSERIEKIAISEYGMRLAESDEIVRVEVGRE
jgi:cell division protein FtsL